MFHREKSRLYKFEDKDFKVQKQGGILWISRSTERRAVGVAYGDLTKFAWSFSAHYGRVGGVTYHDTLGAALESACRSILRDEAYETHLQKAQQAVEVFFLQLPIYNG